MSIFEYSSADTTREVVNQAWLAQLGFCIAPRSGSKSASSVSKDDMGNDYNWCFYASLHRLQNQKQKKRTATSRNSPSDHSEVIEQRWSQHHQDQQMPPLLTEVPSDIDGLVLSTLVECSDEWQNENVKLYIPNSWKKEADIYKAAREQEKIMRIKSNGKNWSKRREEITRQIDNREYENDMIDLFEALDRDEHAYRIEFESDDFIANLPWTKPNVLLAANQPSPTQSSLLLVLGRRSKTGSNPSELTVERIIGSLLCGFLTFPRAILQSGQHIPNEPLAPYGSAAKPDLASKATLVMPWAGLSNFLCIIGECKTEATTSDKVAAQLAFGIQPTLDLLILWYLTFRKTVNEPLQDWMFIYGLYYDERGITVNAHWPQPKPHGDGTLKWGFAQAVVFRDLEECFSNPKPGQRIQLAYVLLAVQAHASHLLSKLKDWEKHQETVNLGMLITRMQGKAKATKPNPDPSESKLVPSKPKPTEEAPRKRPARGSNRKNLLQSQRKDTAANSGEAIDEAKAATKRKAESDPDGSTRRRRDAPRPTPARSSARLKDRV